MPTPSPLALPVSNAIALLDSFTLFVIQMLVAQHPELLAAPDEPPLSSLRPTRHAHLLLRAVQELQYAIEIYRACIPAPIPTGDIDDDPGDDFPF